MRTSCVKIVLVLGILFLFICTGITPSVAVDTVKKPSMPISNGKTLYVGGTGEGNYTKIQDAIDDASDGDTVFVYDEGSPYYENLIVNKSINLIGEDKNNTVITCTGTWDEYAITINADSVNVSGFKIENTWAYGHTGIRIHSNNTVITENILIGNGNDGITVFGNNNTIRNNIFDNNGDGIGLDDLYTNNTVIGNTIVGSTDDGIFGGNGNIISGNNISNNDDCGISLNGESDNVIYLNTISNNKNDGIRLVGSSDNIISHNNINFNKGDGIALWYSSNKNNISHNLIFKNLDIGIELYESFENVITQNNISSYPTGTIGIMFYFSDSNIISDNIVHHNYHGIEFQDSEFNIISGNNLIDNNNSGVWLRYSSNDNKVYHNNFINNTWGPNSNANDECTNSWDDDYPSGGNYWSDFDEPSEGAWDNNSDGIADAPYNISGDSNQDRYPFMNSYGWLNLPPVSDPNGPYSAYKNENIVFDGSGSCDPDGYIVSYHWDFGDGQSGTGVKPTHKYTKDGTYIVNLTVIDDYGVRNYSTTTATIEEKSPGPPPYVPPNKKPKAKITVSDKFEFVGVPIDFSGSDSNDDDGYIVNYSWDFGDGNMGYGEDTSHAFMGRGSYKVTLMVTDDDGATDKDTIRVIIRNPNRPPEMTAFCDICIKIGIKNVDYGFIAEAIDLDGDNISYVFNWSDESDLTITDYVPNGTSSEALHRWSNAGVYPVVVYAIDDYNATSERVSLIMLIDSVCVSELGYFFDSDDDGVFDVFFSNETESKTCCEMQENGIYCIDTDGDEAWDYRYDSISGSILAYGEQEPLDEGDKSLLDSDLLNMN